MEMLGTLYRGNARGFIQEKCLGLYTGEMPGHFPCIKSQAFLLYKVPGISPISPGTKELSSLGYAAQIKHTRSHYAILSQNVVIRNIFEINMCYELVETRIG
ncbi:5072_t:CDS:2, partial [Gigaspora margarita]